MTRMTWLNGWPLLPNYRSVLMGTGVHCSGCGKFFGIACVGFSENYVEPEREPDWPFDEDKCPICYEPASTGKREPTIDERLAAYKAAEARRKAKSQRPEGGAT